MTDTPDRPESAANPAGDSADTYQRLADKLAEISREVQGLSANAALQPLKFEIDAAGETFRKLFQAYARDPDGLVEAQHDFFGRQSDAIHQIADGVRDPGADSDPRFSDPAWSANPFFDYVRRMFLATTAWAEGLAVNAPGLTDLERRRAAFFIRQACAAMSPSNSITANPVALNAWFETDGKSLMRGLDLFQADQSKANGRPSVSQTDPRAFELGSNLAATPGEVILANRLIELIRYAPSREQVFERPLLIFPPWINKYYVLDLKPTNSMAAWLRDQGFTVYMVSWRSACPETADLDWDDYLREGARAALDAVSAAHGGQAVNAAGYCVGGALLATLAARLAATGDNRLASITLLAAQTDFSEPGDLGLFVDADSLNGISALITQSGGVMPGEAMRDAFNALRPEELVWRYVEERYLLGKDPRPFDLLYWNGDQTNIPGPLHLTALRRLYLDNALAQKGFVAEGQAVDLGAISTPVFLHAARRDHISPFPSVYKGVHLFGGDVTFLLADSGHIAGVVNPPAAGKYCYWTNPAKPATSAEWFAGASEHPGSWWPVWASWLAEHSGALTSPPAPVPNAPAAPGRYVRETLDQIRARFPAAGA